MVSRKYLSKCRHCGIPVCSDLSVADTFIRNTAIHKKDRNARVFSSLCVRLDSITCNIVTDDCASLIRNCFAEGL